MNKLLKQLSVYKTDYTLKNFGQTKPKGNCLPEDGYYVVPTEPMNNITKCITIGVGDMIDFEEELSKEYPNINFSFYDGTVDKLPVENDKFTFYKNNVSQIDISNNKSLNSILLENKVQNEKTLLKIDCEGAEYNTIPYVNEDLLANVDVLILELHWIADHYFEAIELLEQLNKNYTLIHSHGISWCGTLTINEEKIPNVIELTFVNKNIDTNNLGNIFYRPEIDKIQY